MSTSIELDAPPQERSILVLGGRRLQREHVLMLREQLNEALKDGKWPILLAHDGPVYWVPVGPPEPSEPEAP